MEPEADFIPHDSSLPEAIAAFFKERTFGDTQNTFLKLFRCWGIKECHKSIGLTDAEVALFLDQLLVLLEAVYISHQSDKG